VKVKRLCVLMHIIAAGAIFQLPFDK